MAFFDNNEWNKISDSEKLAALGHLIEKMAGNYDAAKVRRLQTFVAIHKAEKDLLREQVKDLKKELANEKRRAAFYLKTSDQYRADIEKLMETKNITKVLKS